MAYIPPLNGGRLNASIGGNSTSAGVGYALASTGTLLLAGGNNITLSQNGASVTISGANAPSGSINFSASNTSANLASVTFSNSNGVSFGLTNGTITASHNGITTQTNQSMGLYGLDNTTQNSSTTLDARSLSFNGLGGATVGFSNGSIQISGAQTVAQSNQSAGLYALGNTTQNSSTTLDARSLSFNGLGAATMGYSNGSIQVSVPAQTAQTQSLIAGMYDGANSISTGTVRLSNANGVSFGINGQTLTASHNAVTSQSNQNVSLYALGNTTQNSSTLLNASNLSFNGLGNVSVGFSNGSIQISQTGGGAGGGVALYDGANSISSGTARFSNSNGVSFGFNGQTITGSVVAQTNQTVGLYALGNTTQNSSTTLDARTMSFNGLGAATMGYSNGSIQVSAPATSSLSVTGGLSVSTNVSTISLGIQPMSQWMHNSAAMYSSSTSAMVNTSVSVVRMLIPYNLSFSRVDIPVSFGSGSSAAANTAAMALSAVGVIYSRNGSTLNPIVGQSSTTTYSYASNTGVYASITGPRLMSFNLATSLTAGEYYMGLQLSSNTSSVGTATTNLTGFTLAPVFGTTYTVVPWQDISAATNQTINILQPMQGMNNVSLSNTTQTMQQSQITQSGATAIRANLVVILRNV